MMLGDRLVNSLVMHLQNAQRGGFVAAHLATEAYHVGEHDGGQLTGLGLQHCRDSLILLCTPSNVARNDLRVLGGDPDESSQLSQCSPRSKKFLAWNGDRSSSKSRIMDQHSLFFSLYYDQGVQTLCLPIVQRSRGDENDRWNVFL